MKTLWYSVLVCLIVSSGFAKPGEDKWNAFSKNLVRAIQSSNEGLQISAMSMIIRYGDSLYVKDAVFDLVKIFRNHSDQRVRRLAMVTLYKIQDGWAMYFLRRNRQFEKNQTILRQSCCIVNSYYKKCESPSDDKQ
jgi:hypothetical protein